MFRSFQGGIRFHSLENEAKKYEIMRIDDAPRLWVSLRQEGIVCRSQVEIGSRVLRYQPIAVPERSYGGVIYSPVSGTVVGVEAAPHPFVGTVDAIVIDNDGKMEEMPCTPEQNAEALQPLDLIEIAQRAAIPGPKQYSRPEYMRLLKMRHNGVQTLVCNVAETAPFSGHMIRVTLEHTDQVLRGLLLLMRAAGARRGVFAVTSGESKTISALRHAVAACPEETQRLLHIAQVADKYPAADRMKEMFAERDLSFGEKPVEAGVTTPFACLSMARAVEEGVPVTEIPITVSGTSAGSRRVVQAPIGTPLSLLLERLGYTGEDRNTLVLGGAMNGIALGDENYTVLRCMGSLLSLVETTDFSRSDDCIHCGRCGSVCPQGLSPSFLCEYVRQENLAEAKLLGLEKCKLCGCCTYICPGRVEITEILKQGKKAIQ